MCGLAGVFKYGMPRDRVGRPELLRMSGCMRSRGPDADGIWVSDECSVGMAHRRLAIIDLSAAGDQPMTDEARNTVAFNGEIYNYKELRSELEAKGYRFRSHSDTEVILHLYREHRSAFPAKLRGMYAIALWDAQDQTLLLIRDPFGIKPLYYADDGGTVRFASQVKALLAGGTVRNELDPAGVVGFYVWGHVPEPYTIYRQIRSLPAGVVMRFRPSHDATSQVFQDVVGQCASEAPQNHNDFDIHHALLESVKAHMVADVPVGAFLSSGIDSSVICALAVEAGATNLRTVTLGFREYVGSGEDEVPLAQTTARMLGTAHESRWVSKHDFESELATIIAAMDQPTVDGINTYFVSKVAAESGLKVALSGIGGDELFAGYSSFSEIPRLVRWTSRVPAAALVGQAVRSLAAPIFKRLTSAKYASLLEYGSTYDGAFLLRRGLFMPWELPAFLDGGFVRTGWDELNTRERLRKTVSRHTHDYCRVTALETVWYLQSRILRDTDWAGMAHSLEIRTPLVDVVLWKQLMTRLCSATGLNKSQLASTAQTRLPSDISTRKKSGFNVPIRDWLLQSTHAPSSTERGLRGWARFIARAFEFA